VLEAAQGGLVHLKRELATAAGVSMTVLDGLVDEGTLETVALAPEARGRNARPGLRSVPT
jgi:primosomal protein N' (replication factor Y)